MQFALVLPDRAALAEFVWPYTAQAVATIDQLSRIRYIDPPPLRSDVINRFIGDAAPRYGSVERIVPSGRGLAAVSGWASLPQRRVADAVLLTRSSPDGEHVVAMSIRTALERPDIAASDPALLHSGWLVRVPASLLRSGTTISAWSWDSSAERAYRLAGGIKAEGPIDESGVAGHRDVFVDGKRGTVIIRTRRPCPTIPPTACRATISPPEATPRSSFVWRASSRTSQRRSSGGSSHQRCTLLPMAPRTSYPMRSRTFFVVSAI